MAPAALAASTVRLAKVVISIFAPLFLAMPAVSAFSISIFSSAQNSGVFPGCTPMPMTSRVDHARRAGDDIRGGRW